MKNYSVIVFDLGNVLIPFDYSKMINKLNDIADGLGDHFEKLYRDNYEAGHRKFERWQITNDQFLDLMMEWTKNNITREEFCHIYSDIFEVNKEVSSLLPQLKEKYQLVLLSNTNDIHKKYGWEKYDFLKHFDKLILSHEIGAVKPEEKIYKAVEQFTQKPADEHIFIDDIKEYVDAAKNLNWDGIQFTGYDNLVAELQLRNIL
ncbi:MAG: HAD family phosphatase [Melioribacteraceae bacterium]|nr:HAD family phosphatase [Melioribacteraceae bacterium]MCF8353572.1 HAD family phosphatase [Melioribacteraceae bacterium]MCF8393495.1 HAD family phosphatase [Melioribacteraceae bacterium]MCF8419305.1 HAD family phosphatase [Melioribacteraceae bacterium]